VLDIQGAVGTPEWASALLCRLGGLELLAAAGRVVEGRRGGPLTTAAVDYDRGPPGAVGPRPAAVPGRPGASLRRRGDDRRAARFFGRPEHKQLFALVAQLGALADAVTRLRENQDRAAQAAAARSAAEQLHRLAPAQRTPADGSRAREPVSALARARETAARLVAEDNSRLGGPTPPSVYHGRGLWGQALTAGGKSRRPSRRLGRGGLLRLRLVGQNQLYQVMDSARRGSASMGSIGTVITSIISGLLSGTLATAVWGTYVQRANDRESRLARLSQSLETLRSAEITEHSANMVAYNAPGSRAFQHGVDTSSVTTREQAQRAAEQAVNVSPGDPELRDCVAHFRQAVASTVFAQTASEALAGNKMASYYLTQSGDQINRLHDAISPWNELRGHYEVSDQSCPRM